MASVIHSLLFSLGGELFGISVENVLRVINLEMVIGIPKAPSFIRGAINLEGNVVPVVNLAKKIDLDYAQSSDQNKVIILEVNHDDETIQVGVLIDEVLDVISMEPSKIIPPPLERMGFDTNTLDGMYKVNDDFYMILNARKIFERELVEMVH